MRIHDGLGVLTEATRVDHEALDHEGWKRGSGVELWLERSDWKGERKGGGRVSETWKQSRMGT